MSQRLGQSGTGSEHQELSGQKLNVCHLKKPISWCPIHVWSSCPDEWFDMQIRCCVRRWFDQGGNPRSLKSSFLQLIPNILAWYKQLSPLCFECQEPSVKTNRYIMLRGICSPYLLGIFKTFGRQLHITPFRPKKKLRAGCRHPETWRPEFGKRKLLTRRNWKVLCRRSSQPTYFHEHTSGFIAVADNNVDSWWIQTPIEEVLLIQLVESHYGFTNRESSSTVLGCVVEFLLSWIEISWSWWTLTSSTWLWCLQKGHHNLV